MPLKSLEQGVLEYCDFPIPRTASEIADFLKGENPSFYPATKTARVAAFIRKKMLRKLIEENRIIEYSPNDDAWPEVRGFLKAYYLREGKPLPRKLPALYHVNFLPPIKTPPALNLRIATTLCPRLKARGDTLNPWEVLNLLFSYTENRDRIRFDLYKLDFDEKEREEIEKLLESSQQLATFFGNFPFMSHIGRARQFLARL